MKATIYRQTSYAVKQKNEESIKDLLSKIIGNGPMQSKLFEAKVERFWRKTMAPAFNKYTKTIRIRNHTLYLEISSASLRQELELSKNKVLELVNKEIGQEYIKKVVVL